jgi:putative transposase
MVRLRYALEIRARGQSGRARRPRSNALVGARIRQLGRLESACAEIVAAVSDRRLTLNPPRLSRLDFVFERDPIYFVTACIQDRRNLLANPAAHDCFKRFALAAPKFGPWVGKYVLMPDHLHLFIALDDQQLSLSRWIKSLKGTLSSRFRVAQVSPPYWQKGFFDHVLRSSESYLEKWHYVQENPARTGLIKEYEDWPYAVEVFNLEFSRDCL